MIVLLFIEILKKKFLDFLIIRTGFWVVIDDADGLHEGVDDGGADECHAAFFEVFRDGVTESCGGWRFF